MEKAQGLSPIEMVDRNFKYKLPSIQVSTETCINNYFNHAACPKGWFHQGYY